MGKRKKPAALASITAEERIEYASRQMLFKTKQMEALAAAAYLDQLGEELKDRYDLPTAYNLDLATGDVTAVELVEA